MVKIDDRTAVVRSSMWKSIFCVAAFLLGTVVVAYLHGVSLRNADLISGRNSLRFSWHYYNQEGYATNHGNSYEVWLTNNTVTIDGTNYQCVMTLDDDRFHGKGVMSFTATEEYIWHDKERGPKLVPPGYSPPLFPPIY